MVTIDVRLKWMARAPRARASAASRMVIPIGDPVRARAVLMIPRRPWTVERPGLVVVVVPRPAVVVVTPEASVVVVVPGRVVVVAGRVELVVVPGRVVVVAGRLVLVVVVPG